LLKVTPLTPDEASLVKEGAVTISFLSPLANLETVKKLASRKATVFAMELVPRISRAQPMDALSSQANVAGYKAVILAADTVPKLFPLMMTAAGTISPAKVFILGAGVAGLQAIATAKRLGAIVEAYDVRPVVKEQVMSLGAKFAEMPVEAKDAQDAGGYAKAMGEEFTKKQQEFLAGRAKLMDVVITTALIPNQRAPILITEDAVKGMRPGSVVVDLAAEAKGNCAVTEPGKTVVKYGVTIHGPLNLPSTMAPESSRLYSKNISSLLLIMLKEGKLTIDPKDDLVKGAMVVNAGQIVHGPTLKAIEGPAPAGAPAGAKA
jgi:NAD(P) transhydrogenase subunit alpha